MRGAANKNLAPVLAPVLGIANKNLAPVLATLLMVAIVACGGPSTSPEPSVSRSGDRHAWLAQGVAKAEVEQWAEARALFEQASRQPGAPTAALYDLAVAQFRLGEMAAAAQTLDLLGEGEGGGALAHRPDLLRARLAYEAGNTEGELTILRAARQRHADEPAVLHALVSALERLRPPPAELGEVLEAAWRSWPRNSRLASAFATWALGEPARRDEGLAVLGELVAEIGPLVPQGGAMLEALWAEGRAELTTAAPGQVPTPLRRALNLLRASPRFSADAAALESRIRILPVAPNPPMVMAEGGSVTVVLEGAPVGVVPPAPLDQGEAVVAMLRIDDAIPEPVGGSGTVAPGREAMVALLGERGLAVLPRAGAWQRVAEITGGLLLRSGDFDDDGRPELVVATRDGLAIWGRGTAGGETFEPFPTPELPAELTLPIADLLVVDFEHDGDLDLLLVDAAGRVGWAMHRGEAGLGVPESIDFGLDAAITRIIAADLDHDDDQDLVVATRGATGSTELVWLRNWKQGHFTAHQRLIQPQPVIDLAAADFDGDGRVDVATLDALGAVTLHRGLDLDRLGAGETVVETVVETAAETLVETGSSGDRPELQGQVLVTDLDLDGGPELLMVGASGLRAVVAEGEGFAITTLDPGVWAGALPLDLDGDHDPDLLSWGGGGGDGPGAASAPRALLAGGAEGQRWIALALRAPERKAPRDGHGVRIAITAGGRTRQYQPQRANGVFGLGGDEPALVVATWPNGISEYLFDPAVDSRHEIALSLRVEGSCPFLYVSDGEGQRFVTDILGLAPLGMLASRRSFVPADPEEYLRLPDWTRPMGDRLTLKITEELREATYLDQSELVVVDAPLGVEVYNGEQWLPRPVVGLELRLLGPLRAPTKVWGDGGDDVTELVAQRDGRYLANHRGLEPGGRRYQGAVAPHRLEIELDPADLGRRGALLLVGWLHWGNTSTNVARSQDPAGAPLFPRLEVSDGHGGWRPTDIEVGLPAGKTKPVVVDLGDPEKLAGGGGRGIRLRITTDFEVYWDQVAVAELLPAATTPHRIHRLAPQGATLSFGGFSRWVRDSPEGPYGFDLAERRPYPWRRTPEGGEIALAWQELEGFYTAMGDVTERLVAADDDLVIFGAGDQLDLVFDLATLPAPPAGWHRIYFLHSEGWEKDGDPNVSCGTTVEPLPYRGMEGDPCALADPLAVDPSRHSRWVRGDRLRRRLATTHPGG